MSPSTASLSLSLRFFLWIAVSALCIVVSLPGSAQDLSKLLILKDGSYQLVTKYEVKGDRVRYLSAERGEWEELPYDLVDWKATEKFEKDRQAAPAIPEAAAIDKETDEERVVVESHLPLVAPGLHLPEESGVFLLDNYKGQPQLVEMEQLEGDVTGNARPSIFRGPLGGKQAVELEGEHAAVSSHVAVPSIYINLEEDSNQPPPGQTASAKPSQPSLDAPRAQPQQPQQPQQPEGPVVPFDRFRIVHAQVKKGRRTISNLKRDVAGKVSENQDFVKTTIDKIGPGWFKLTPVGDLAPGEYALVEMQGSGGMNLYVWDFGVNPSAPENKNPWRPDVKDAPKPATPTGDAREHTQ